MQWAQAPEMITAVAFHPSGKLAVAGLFDGHCIFYQSERLRYYTQVRRHGARRGGEEGGRSCSLLSCCAMPCRWSAATGTAA